jgi:hypothetical protein
VVCERHQRSGARLYPDGPAGPTGACAPEKESGAFVYLGSAAGLSITPAWTAESDQVNANFGISVASAGDVNNDGYGDVIIGASGEGRAYLYLGSDSAPSLSTDPSWTAESEQVNTSFGYSVASAGDINNDGFGDVIVGAHQYSNDQMSAGRAFAYAYSPAPPVIVNLDGDSLTYVEDGAAQPLDTGADATVSNTDNSHYDSSFLLVHYAANGSANDQLTINSSGSITLAGAEVRFNGAPIGDIDATLDGVNGTDLMILFDASDADDSALSALIRALRFSTTSQNPATTARTLEISLTNHYVHSNIASITANVLSVNDLPTLTSFADPMDTTAEGTEVEITFVEMAAQGDEADPDGTVVAFVVKSVASGTLSIGASVATATAFAAGTNDTIDAAANAYWTPPAGTSGTLDAFAVTAADNDGAESAGSATAQVSVTAATDNLPATSGGSGGGSGCFISASTR